MLGLLPPIVMVVILETLHLTSLRRHLDLVEGTLGQGTGASAHPALTSSESIITWVPRCWPVTCDHWGGVCVWE